uniref:Polyprotein n=1 Tax=Marafivirus syrahense TaxID=3047855 RepID=A0AAF1C0R0_9VIRU|nr:polyprotein [Marafivirus syrahense]
MAAPAFAYASTSSAFFALFQEQELRSFRLLTLAHSLRCDAPLRARKVRPAPSTSVSLPAAPSEWVNIPITVAPQPLTRGGRKELVEMLAPTTHRVTVASPILEAVAGPLRTSIQRYPYEVPTHAVPVLQRFGIEASGFGFKAHPDPVHKTIEIHLLSEHWLNLCRSPSAVPFMKQRKFEKLQHENANFEALANYNLTARDTTRYERVAVAPPTQAVWFMHDALQYYSLAQVAAFFADCPHLEKLFASLVVPPESDFTNLSLFPEIYRYSFAGSRLNYQLEGKPGHSYSQPREALEWLKTTTIRCGSLYLTVTKRESWGPVHSLLVQRGKPSVHLEHDEVSCVGPDAGALPEAAALRQELRHRLVPCTVFDALFIYVRAVRILRTTDPVAFVRTQSNKAEYSWVTSAAWDNLQHFVTETAAHRVPNRHFLFNSTFAKCRYWCSQHKRGLFTATTPPACGLTLFTGPKLAFARSSRITALDVFHHWVVPPPTLFFTPKAPLLAIQLTRLPQPLFSAVPFLHKTLGNLSLRLLIRFPFLRRFFSAASIPTWARLLTVVIALSPAVWLAIRHFLGPDGPQALNDHYVSFFHPDRWHLTFVRQPRFVALDRTFPGPLPQAREPTEPRDSDVPFETVPSPLPVVAPQPAPATSVAPVETSDTTVSAVEPSLSTESLKTVEAPSGTTILQPRELKDTIHPLPAAALVVASPQPAPAPTEPDSASTVLGNAPLSRDVHMGHVSTPATEPGLVEPDHSPLAADSSATGEVSEFFNLHPADWIAPTATFRARRRGVTISVAKSPAMDCLLAAVSAGANIPKDALWKTICCYFPDSMLRAEDIAKHGLSTHHFAPLARDHRLQATFHSAGNQFVPGVEHPSVSFHIDHTPESATALGHISVRADERQHTPPLLGGRAAGLVHAALKFKVGNAVHPFQQAHDYTTSVPRAKNLISNMKNGFDGVLGNIDPAHTKESRDRLLSLDGAMDIAAPRDVKLNHIAGFPGCGKSYSIAQLLKSRAFKHFKITVPTVELRNEWKGVLKVKPPDNWRISTWESSLLKSARILVIDEIYKMPRGCLDLAIHADPTIDLVIALGDPLQGVDHSTHYDSSNHRLSGEVKHLQPFMDYYCLRSHRVPQDIGEFFGIKSTSTVPGFKSYQANIPGNLRQLANSQSAAKVLNQCGFSSDTIASSQGSPYSAPACIHLERHSMSLSHAHSLVALTRSKSGVIFTGDKRVLEAAGGNLLFSSYFQDKKVDLRALLPMEFPSCPVLLEPLKCRPTDLTGGPPSPFSNEARVFDPQRRDVVSLEASIVLRDGSSYAPQVSTHFLTATRRHLHFDLPSAKPEFAAHEVPAPLTDTLIEPVYPGETFENVAVHFLPAHDPEVKEILFKDHRSNQFPFMDQPFQIGPQPASLCAAVHHSKKDPTLLAASFEKRLRFRASDAPYQITAKDEILGSLLFESHCRAVRRDPNVRVPFDEALFAECRALNELAQLTSKPQAVIMANHERSAPDWRYTAVRIFAKIQHKVNSGSLFGPWKACQTLALMRDAVILLFGPVKKYQLIHDERDRPERIFIYAGRTPQEMAEWSQKFLTPRSASSHVPVMVSGDDSLIGSHTHFVANDYTAFEQSQHGEPAALERLKMERVNIPEWLIALHIMIKTHITTQFGPLTCMRLTGEPGTYFDNSDYNLAVIFLEYSRSGQWLSDNPLWPAIKPLLALRFKKEKSRYGNFCGYYDGAAGAVRMPKALFDKILIAVDDVSIADKMASYATEFSIGHSLGDALWSLLAVEAVVYQSAVFDFPCRNAPREVKLLFKLGPVERSVVEAVQEFATWASYAFYRFLNSAQRKVLLTRSPQLHFPGDAPQVSQLQGELLQSFSMMKPTLPLTGGLLLRPAVDAPMSDDSLAGRARSQRDTDHRSDPQPALPLAPSVHETSGGPAITVPFQWGALVVKSESTIFTVDPARAKSLTQLIGPYRHARLLSLEAILMPTLNAFPNPVTVHIVWTFNTVEPASGEELFYPGGPALAVGGPVSMSALATVPADVSRLNTVIRGAVAFLDTPRLTGTTMKCAKSETSPMAYVVIRGALALSGPVGTRRSE